MSDGDFLTRYRLDRVVHRGTLGTLYIAEQLALRRTVLLRVVAKEIAADAAKRNRLVEQIERLSRTDDKALAPILDLGEVEGQPFYAIERLDGVDLKTAAHRDSRLYADGATPPDLVVRTRELRELLHSCRRLGASLLPIADLRPDEVLLVEPFRFVLSEPCLAGSVVPGSGRAGDALRATIEMAFAVTFDPAWDARDKIASRAAATARSSVFQDLSSAEALEPDRLLEAAIEALGRLGARATATTADALVRPSASGRRWGLRRRHVFRAALVGMLAASLGMLGWAASLQHVVAAEHESRRLLAAGRRGGDLAAMDALAFGAHEVPVDVRSEARAVVGRMLEEVLDRALDAQVAKLAEGAEPVPEPAPLPDLPAGCAAQYRTRLGTASAALGALASRVRGVFDSDPEKGMDALLTIAAGDAPVEVKRAVVLRALGSRPGPLVRCAATALAAGVAGYPEALETRLGALLLDPDTDPVVGLALVGWFAHLPDERGTPVLRRLAKTPRERVRVVSPDKDRFALRLHRAVHQSDDVLSYWLGPGYAGPANENRPMTLREAALFALEKIEPRHALALLQEATQDMGELGRACAIVVSRHAERISSYDMEEMLRAAFRSGDGDLIRPVVKAVAARDAALARAVVMTELRSGRTANEGGVLIAVVEEGLVADPAALVACLAQCPMERVRDLAPFVDRSRELTRILLQVAPGALSDQDRARVALLRAKSDLAVSEDVDELIARVGDRRAPPALRVMALQALGTTADDRVYRCLRGVIADETHPREMRVLALELSRRILGTPRTSYLTSRVTTAKTADAASIMESMTRAVAGTDSDVRDYAAEILADYESPTVERMFRARISLDAPAQLLETATGYFAFVRIDPAAAEELDPVMIALLRDPEVAETTKANALSYFTANERPSCLPDVLELLPDVDSESCAAAALQYVGTRLGDTGVAEALVDFVQSTQTLAVRMMALELLSKRVAAGHGPEPDVFATILAEASDPEVVFGCAEILLRARGVPPIEPLVVAFRRQLVRLAAAGSSSRDLRLLRSVDFGTPRILFEVRPEGFDQQLVADALDNELEGHALAGVAILLIQRLAKARSGADMLDQLLQGRNLTVAGLVQLLTGDGAADGGVDLPVGRVGELEAVLDFLCSEHYRARREAAPFLARGRQRLRMWHGTYGLPAGAPRGSEALAREGIEDLRWAIHFSGEDVLGLRLELSAAQLEIGDEAGALETLEAHEAAHAGEPGAAYLVVDQLVRMGRSADARARMERVGRRDTEYWRRRIDLEAADSRSDPKWIAELLAAPQWRDPRSLLAIAPHVLSHLFERREDPACASMSRDLAGRLARILRTDFVWRNRALAAFHLSWLSASEFADDLALAARTDTDARVQGDALWALYLTRPQLATEIARERLATDDGMLRSMAYWLAARTRDPARLDHLRRGLLAPGSKWTREALSLAVQHDEAQVIAAVAALLDHRDPDVRRLAAGALGVFGARGHRVDEELLRTCFLHEVDREVAHASGQALGLLGSDKILEDCRNEIRDFLLQRRSAAASDRLLPSRLAMLGAHRSDEALKLIEQVIEVRRQRFKVDVDAMEAQVNRLAAARDDELIGDLADTVVAMGDLVRARALYQRAAEIDPDDSEWSSKLLQLERGRIPEGIRRTGDDRILGAALEAKAEHEARRDPPVLGSGFRAQATGGSTLLGALRMVLAPGGTEPAPAELGPRVLAALEILGSWPHFALSYATAPAGAAASGDVVADLLDAFGGRLPQSIADAAELLAQLPELHAVLTGSSTAQSRQLSFEQLVEGVRTAWVARR